MRRNKREGRRVDAAYSEEVRRHAQRVLETAHGIRELDKVREWALTGVRLVDEAYKRLPAKVRTFAETSASLEQRSGLSNTLSLQRAWWDASMDSFEYEKIALKVREHRLSPPHLASALQRLRSSLERVVTLLPNVSTLDAIDTADALLQAGFSVVDKFPRAGKAESTVLLIVWKGGRPVLEAHQRPTQFVVRLTRAQIAHALDRNDDALKARRRRRRAPAPR